MRKAQWLGTRWLGVGLAAVLAVVTISLAVTGRLGLYINPDSTWFAVSMAVVVLIGTVASFALPLGAEADHGHDHGDPSHAHSSHAPAPVLSPALSPARPPATSPASRQDTPDDRRGLRRVLASQGMGDAVEGQGHGSAGEHVHHTPHPLAVTATVVGGVAASGVVLLTLVLPPASLSAELAMSRDVGATPLFGGADTIQLASTGDTGSFGVGEWATVFATSTNPDAFDGDTIELTGFVTPGDDDAFDLTRLVITHCVIDAQPASLPVVAADIPATGQWVTISGTVQSSSDGRLVVDAESVDEIAEPEDPYEY
ncbi:TIGR03943 family protein [Microbacterium sp. M3]|uniref:TIGR03943 family protein n=1 Tax=Microbacterium arthrosphaerae TaxID=792652 RepID=A0ABU4H6B6_9MICO|nr:MULTISPECIES: TIGR03943 family protein [Microbacterium]MDW4574190.1 TIGR03943 family protein [Microbacterium arthrosphaerae]MDW7608045.1 TIGR03943 family protein [Microbacterium sp. M3]